MPLVRTGEDTLTRGTLKCTLLSIRVVVESGDNGLSRMTRNPKLALKLDALATPTAKPDANDRISDDGTRFAGLLFGASDASAHGDWGVFATPSGSVGVEVDQPARHVVDRTVQRAGAEGGQSVG